jgi:hypothetical protein
MNDNLYATYISIHNMRISSCEFIVNITCQVFKARIRKSCQFLSCLISFRMEFFAHRQKGH